MRSLRLLGLVFALTAGCANVIGLSGLEEVECVGAACSDASIDAAPDTAIAESSPADGAIDSAELDAATDSAEPETSAVDSAIDSGLADGDATTAADAPTDTLVADTKPDVVASDACTVTCDTVRSNGATCLGSACAYSSCKAGFANCDTTAPDLEGCETPTTNTLNCGGCGVKCEPTNASTASCTASLCAYTCTSGFGDCDKTGGNTNGCETPLNTTANCGACGAKCDTVRSLGATCGGSGCSYTGCAPGFTNCDTAGTDANGCETDTSTSPSNCGGCGRACSTTNVATAACAAGACTSTCKVGFANCSKPTVGADDGCECATPGCCAGGCAVTHKNSVGTPGSWPLGQSYFLSSDYCKGVGVPGDASTYTVEMATAAANAWPTAGTLEFLPRTSGAVVCKNAGSTAAIWVYTGANAGHVYYTTTKCAGDVCNCAVFATDPTWN